MMAGTAEKPIGFIDTLNHTTLKVGFPKRDLRLA